MGRSGTHGGSPAVSGRPTLRDSERRSPPPRSCYGRAALDAAGRDERGAREEQRGPEPDGKDLSRTGRPAAQACPTIDQGRMSDRPRPPCSGVAEVGERSPDWSDP